MTPSEQEQAPVLDSGHLHPFVLLLRLFEALRQILVPLVLGALVERWFLALALALLLIQLGYALARFLTFQYVLTREELVTREGILSRRERRIPTNRIQDLGIESTLLRRFLGLAVVSVETASGKGAEALLDSLGRGDAERLRSILMASRGGGRGSAAGGAPPAMADRLVHRTDAGLLFVRGFTDLRLSALLLAVFAAWEISDQLGLSGRVESLASSLLRWLAGFSPALLVAIGTAVLLLVLGSSLAASAVANLVMFHGFVVTLRDQVLQRRYGLLTTRQKSLPLSRVQRVLVEQNWLRRLFGFAVVRADSAGSGMDDAREARGGWDVVGPLVPVSAAFGIVSVLIPPVEFGRMRPVSARVIPRVGILGSLGAAFLSIALTLSFGPAGLLALALIPLSFLAGWLYWRNLGYSVERSVLVLRSGVLGRYLTFVPSAKVQSVTLRAGPIERLLGLASITVRVAGGSPSSLASLPRAEAEAIAGELAAAAAEAASRDWGRVA
ncbi:MAG: hypothetical protein Fur0037_05980 [Planctomycetota bacterium]